MGKADLHIHTSYSYDSSCTVSAVLEWAAKSTDLDVIAITDHDALGGAAEAVKQAPEFGIEVIPGCEVTTRDGHLLALFVDKPIPPGRSLVESVLRVGDQGGIAIAAHPTSFPFFGMRIAALYEVVSHPIASQIIVGLETWNTGLFYLGSNRGAQQLNQELMLAPTGGSDSHVFWTVGFGYTEFAGRTAQDLRRSLEQKTTAACCQDSLRWPSYWPNHFVSRVLRSMGWVTWAPQPDADLVLRRLNEVQANF